MGTFNIILIILGYILMGALTAICIHKIFPEQERFECVSFGFFWPITILLVIFGTIAMIPTALFTLIANWWEKIEDKSEIN